MVTKEKTIQWFGKNTYHVRLCHLYGETLNKVSLIFDNDTKKLIHVVEKVKVYNPIEQRITPSTGCDICIDGYSYQSNYIYSIGKEESISGYFYLSSEIRFHSSTFCFDYEIEEVKSKQEKYFIKEFKKERENLISKISFLDSVKF